jgi:Fe-S oxidoreductase
MDLCLSCKACKSECPSNVDMAKLKAEFLQHYYNANGIPFRSKLIANITKINQIGMIAPSVFNFFQKNSFISGITKNLLGFAPERNIPLLWPTTLRAWSVKQMQDSSLTKSVYLFADEFTNFNDVEIGMKAIKILNKLGYKVIIPDHTESGRTYLSKGLVKKAQKIANYNVSKLALKVSAQSPLIGIEPSAILTFRDEYPDLVDPELKTTARELATNALMFDEFIAKIFQPEMAQYFTSKSLHIRLHGHCHQKALASVAPTINMLSLPPNYKVEEVKSGCCGMAGAFGYEREHYEVSMKVGELVLFPEVRKSPAETVIAAPGTSCRHQIFDGTGRKAWHPVEVLYDAITW